MATSTIGTAAAYAAIGATPGLASDGEPQTPKGVPEDVVESEGEPEVAPEVVPEVVQEEALAEGAISVSEAVSTAHQALSQAQHVLHREGEDLADQRCRLRLWAGMLKRTTMSERAVARDRQRGFDL